MSFSLCFIYSHFDVYFFFFLLKLGFVCSSFSRFFRCIRFFEIFLFSRWVCIAINSPFRMAFAAFHRFCYVIFSFSLVRYLWISSLILHWPNSCSLACCLGLPWCSTGRESACTIPGSGRSSGRGHGNTLQYSWASLVAQIVKNLPAMQEFWVQSLGWEDPLEEGMATHSSILAHRIPKDREAWQAKTHRATKSRTQLND